MIIPSSFSLDLACEDQDWESNNLTYKFGPGGNDFGTATVIKKSDGEIEATLEVISAHPVYWNTLLPEKRRYPIRVVFSWDLVDANLSIAGKKLERRPLSRK